MDPEIQESKAVELPKTVTRFIPLLRTAKDVWNSGPVCHNVEGERSALEWLTQRTHDEANCRVIKVELPL